MKVFLGGLGLVAVFLAAVMVTDTIWVIPFGIAATVVGLAINRRVRL